MGTMTLLSILGVTSNIEDEKDDSGDESLEGDGDGDKDNQAGATRTSLASWMT